MRCPKNRGAVPRPLLPRVHWQNSTPRSKARQEQSLSKFARYFPLTGNVVVSFSLYANSIYSKDICGCDEARPSARSDLDRLYRKRYVSAIEGTRPTHRKKTPRLGGAFISGPSAEPIQGTSLFAALSLIVSAFQLCKKPSSTSWFVSRATWLT